MNQPHNNSRTIVSVAGLTGNVNYQHEFLGSRYSTEVIRNSNKRVYDAPPAVRWRSFNFTMLKSNTYWIAEKIEKDIWAVLGDTPISKDLYQDRDGKVQSIKDEMNPDLKLIYTYYHNRNQIRDNVIRPLRNILSLLPEYKNGTRDIHVPVYKMTIKANARQLHTYKHHLLTSDGTLAVDILHAKLQNLRHNLSRKHSSYRIKNSYPHITFTGGLHSHGVIFGHISHKIVTRMSEYLNKNMPFTVYLAVNPLKANIYDEQVTLGNHDCNNDLSAVQQWLTYAHRSGKLAFPSTKHPEHYLDEWQSLSKQGKYDYVQTCLTSLDGHHHHYNYTYSFNKELDTMIAEILAFVAFKHSEMTHELRVARQAQAVADDEAIYHLHDRWSNHDHSKHIKSTQQWTLAQGKKIDYSQTKDTEQLDLFSTKPHAHIQPKMDVTAIFDNLLEFIHTELETSLQDFSHEVIKAYIPTTEYIDGSSLINHTGVPP